jgi:hypothetical protein
MLRSFGRLLLRAALLPCLFATDLASAGTVTVVLSGTQAPGTPAGVNYSAFAPPALNDAGQIAVTAILTGAGVDSTNDVGIWTGTQSGLAFVARKGSPAPGTSAGVNFLTLSSENPINIAGQVAFFGFLTGPGITATNDAGIWSGQSGSLQVAAREGNGAPGTGAGINFSSFNSPELNGAGQVAIHAFLTGPGVTGTNDNGIWRRTASTTDLVAREGNAAPGSAGATFGFPAVPLINDVGQLAFDAQITGGAGVWRGAPGAVQLIARNGIQAPGAPAGVNFSTTFRNVGLNKSGQVAFLADLVGSGVDATNEIGIWTGNESTLQLVARTGSPAPGTTAGVRFESLEPTSLNESGQVAFMGTLVGGGTHVGNNQGLWRGAAIGVQLVVREGDPAPGAAAGVMLSGFQIAGLNDSGQVAFSAGLSGVGVNTANDRGIYLADAEERIEVIREGNPLAGSTINSFQLYLGPEARSRTSFNSFGQVAYAAALTDGRQGVFVFTPEVRWRRSFSGAWDTASNWTVSIPPANPHDVKIDPAASLTVFGPTGSATIRSLTIGGGTGIATLQLQQGGTVNAPFGVIIEETGGLTGDGTLNGSVTNLGTVVAENVTIAAPHILNNQGVVTGNGRINAVLVNQSGGEVRVANDQHLWITGAGPHLNSGQIEVIDGQLEVHGLLANSGRVLARNALLRFNGGLTNSTGMMLLSFGTSDIFGDIDNALRGQIVISGGSNATFYDNVVNNGELRVSAGSIAVYFGDVTGAGTFTGTGTNFFEGELSPGNSPGAVNFEGDFVMGAKGALRMEIGGTEPGVAYDQLHVAGLLTADGDTNVSLLDGFQPSFGDKFALMSFGELDGWFDTVNLPALSGGLSWSESRGATGYQITVVPEPSTILLSFLTIVLALSTRRLTMRHYSSSFAIRH